MSEQAIAQIPNAKRIAEVERTKKSFAPTVSQPYDPMHNKPVPARQAKVLYAKPRFKVQFFESFSVSNQWTPAAMQYMIVSHVVFD